MSDGLVLLVALPPLVGMFVFAILWLHALDAQLEAEIERDDLWDALHRPPIVRVEGFINEDTARAIERAILEVRRKEGRNR